MFRSPASSSIFASNRKLEKCQNYRLASTVDFGVGHLASTTPKSRKSTGPLGNYSTRNSDSTLQNLQKSIGNQRQSDIISTNNYTKNASHRLAHEPVSPIILHHPIYRPDPPLRISSSAATADHHQLKTSKTKHNQPTALKNPTRSVESKIYWIFATLLAAISKTPPFDRTFLSNACCKFSIEFQPLQNRACRGFSSKSAPRNWTFLVFCCLLIAGHASADTNKNQTVEQKVGKERAHEPTEQVNKGDKSIEASVTSLAKDDSSDPLSRQKPLAHSLSNEAENKSPLQNFSILRVVPTRSSAEANSSRVNRNESLPRESNSANRSQSEASPISQPIASNDTLPIRVEKKEVAANRTDNAQEEDSRVVPALTLVQFREREAAKNHDQSGANSTLASSPSTTTPTTTPSASTKSASTTASVGATRAEATTTPQSSSTPKAATAKEEAHVEKAQIVAVHSATSNRVTDDSKQSPPANLTVQKSPTNDDTSTTKKDRLDCNNQQEEEEPAKNSTAHHDKQQQQQLLLNNNNSTATACEEDLSGANYTNTTRTDHQKMLLIEKHAIDLIPLKILLSNMLSALAAIFMVIGGAIPYVFQYHTICQRKSALGFSLLVCLALCVANILRIMFWFGKRFETVLLVQSGVMIACMLLMLEISVRMNRKMIPKTQRTSIWKGDIIRSFWRWNDLSSFVVALLVFTLITGVITYFFTRYTIYVETLGMVSLLVEACLGLPQLIRNFQRHSTQGMSFGMVFMWLLGDVGKAIYFVVRESPAQFWICASLQITIDVLILGQVYFYGRGNSRIPTYLPAQPTKTAT